MHPVSHPPMFHLTDQVTVGGGLTVFKCKELHFFFLESVF